MYSLDKIARYPQVQTDIVWNKLPSPDTAGTIASVASRDDVSYM